jgi:hypothetical protein
MNTVDQTVEATSGNPAASLSETPSGIGSSCPAGTTTFSAYPPPLSRAQTCKRKPSHNSTRPTRRKQAHAVDSRRHLVSDGPPRGDVGAEREDGAGALEPRVRGRAGGRRVAAHPLDRVRAIDARGGDLEEHLSFPWRGGILYLPRLQHLRPAGARDHHGPHLPDTYFLLVSPASLGLITRPN